MKNKGINQDILPWKAPFQLYTAWVGFIGSTIITLIAGFPVFLKGNWSTSSFIASYIGIPLFIVLIICWKLWHRTVWVTWSFHLRGEFANVTVQFERAVNIGLWSGRLLDGEITPHEKPHNKQPVEKIRRLAFLK